MTIRGQAMGHPHRDHPGERAGAPEGGYRDRHHAGRVLAEALSEYAGRDDVVMLGLPRGGVPVAAEAARVLGLALDIVAVRKLGLPGQPEVAFGAMAGFADGVETVYNEELLAVARQRSRDSSELTDLAAREHQELVRRDAAYREGRDPVPLAGRMVIVVDDGAATGATMRAAVAAVRRQAPAGVVVALPVGSAEACAELGRAADAVVCPWIPRDFAAVGSAYRNFAQVSDREVRDELSPRNGSYH